MRIMFALLCATLVLAFSGCGEGPERSSTPSPKVVGRAIDYVDGDQELEGYLAYDEARTGKRPGVIVVHEWWGLGEHAKERARRLAAEGYVAFCDDMYGKGRLTDAVEQAKQWSGPIYEDARGVGVRRMEAGLGVLRAQPQLDAERVAAVGFCFGGTLVLEWAWSGADLDAVVSFHGNPRPPQPDEAAGVKASVLVCHGAEDPFVEQAAIQALQQGLRGTPVDWAYVEYAGARHSFTNKSVDALGIPGARYHADADQRSWEHMRTLLKERFAR